MKTKQNTTPLLSVKLDVSMKQQQGIYKWANSLSKYYQWKDSSKYSNKSTLFHVESQVILSNSLNSGKTRDEQVYV